MNAYERSAILEKLNELIALNTSLLRSGASESAKDEIQGRLTRLKAIKKQVG